MFSRLATFLFVYSSLLPPLFLIGMVITWNAASAHLGRPPIPSIDDPKDIVDGATEWAYILTILMMFSGLWLLPVYPFLFVYRLYQTIKNYHHWGWFNRLLILTPVVGFILNKVVNNAYFSVDSPEIDIWFMD